MEHNKKTPSTLKRLLYYLGKERKSVSIVILSLLFSVATAVITPLIIADIIDKISEGVALGIKINKFSFNLYGIGKSLALLAIMYVFSFLLWYAEEYFMASVSESVGLYMRMDLMEKLNILPLKFYDSTKRGEILSRATDDIEKVVEVLRENFGQLIYAVLMFIVSIIIMIKISLNLTVISFIAIAVSSILTIFISKKSRKYFSDNQEYIGKLNSTVEETFTGQMVIKAFGQEENSISEFKQLNNQLSKAGYKSQLAINMVPPLVRIFNSLGFVIIAVTSGSMIIQGVLTIGIVQAFIMYVDKTSDVIIELSFVLASMQSAFASADRFFEIMSEDEQVPDLEVSKVIENKKGLVAFEHVRFGYSPDKVLMKDINININAGDRVAIVGPTGAGKTTLVNLLMRFYEIDSGKITVDNVNIQEMERSELRSMFAMVLQDTWLYSGTVLENISYGNFNAPKDDIIGAAVAARADHFIRTLSKGYDTFLKEDDSTISQGQKQLLTIARAILANPIILILDEATSSVDSRTESEIQKAMNHLMDGRTSFIIAHKLSTIVDADLILVMNHGTIIEQGTHKELLKQNGFYENLYNSQFV